MDIVLLVVVIALGLLLLIALVGAAATSRRNRANAEQFSSNLTAVDRQLASAVAADRGWERAVLDAAARDAFAAERPGSEIAGLQLTQIVDEPGTDADLAVFRVATPAGTSRLTLGRRGGEWYARSLEDDR